VWCIGRDHSKGRCQKLSTNNFAIPALTVAELYRYRWQVELFFKWIKQHLRIKSFFGTSENAVKSQIWIAVSVYVFVAIIKKRLDLPVSFYTILQTLSLTVFEKTPLLRLFSDTDYTSLSEGPRNLLNLVRRDKAPFLSGCESRPATVAPAGSSRSGRWR